MAKQLVRVFKDSEEASNAVADEIVSLVASKPKVVLGLATGRTPIALYKELVRRYKAGQVSFKNVVTFNLDEYYPMQPSDPQSYHYFMRHHLFDHIDIPKENIHIPDGTVPIEKVDSFCKNYEELIVQHGGIDLQILGIGRSGHIGFNEPPSSKDSRTRLITLHHQTILDAADDFGGVENVPKQAISMGVGTIMGARRVILMAWSEKKADVIRKAIEEPSSADLPASFLQEHPSATFFLDEPAASTCTSTSK